MRSGSWSHFDCRDDLVPTGLADDQCWLSPYWLANQHRAPGASHIVTCHGLHVDDVHMDWLSLAWVWGWRICFHCF